MHIGLKRALGAMLIAVTLYSLLGFLILPGIALRVINQQLSQLSTVPARLERVQLNPFSLELSLWGLHLALSIALLAWGVAGLALQLIGRKQDAAASIRA